jgi:hypothetical protein
VKFNGTVSNGSIPTTAWHTLGPQRRSGAVKYSWLLIQKPILCISTEQVADAYFPSLVWFCGQQMLPSTPWVKLIIHHYFRNRLIHMGYSIMCCFIVCYNFNMKWDLIIIIWRLFWCKEL